MARPCRWPHDPEGCGTTKGGRCDPHCCHGSPRCRISKKRWRVTPPFFFWGGGRGSVCQVWRRMRDTSEKNQKRYFNAFLSLRYNVKNRVTWFHVCHQEKGGKNLVAGHSNAPDSSGSDSSEASIVDEVNSHALAMVTKKPLFDDYGCWKRYEISPKNPPSLLRIWRSSRFEKSRIEEIGIQGLFGLGYCGFLQHFLYTRLWPLILQVCLVLPAHARRCQTL